VLIAAGVWIVPGEDDGIAARAFSKVRVPIRPRPFCGCFQKDECDFCRRNFQVSLMGITSVIYMQRFQPLLTEVAKRKIDMDTNLFSLNAKYKIATTDPHTVAFLFSSWLFEYPISLDLHLTLTPKPCQSLLFLIIYSIHFDHHTC
jgi:hypothetical protein